MDNTKLKLLEQKFFDVKTIGLSEPLSELPCLTFGLYLTLNSYLHSTGCFLFGISENSKVPFFFKAWIPSSVVALPFRFSKCFLNVLGISVLVIHNKGLST